VLLPDTLPTARLLLRPFGAGDLDDLHAYQSRPDVARYLHWEPRDQAQARAALDQQRRETRLDADGDWLTFAVLWPDAGHVIGETGLKLVSREHRQGETGFVFHPAYGGRGLATEATAAMLTLAFTTLGWHRVTGSCDARNLSSAGLMERLGMRREAHFRHSVLMKGEWADELVYAITEDEWRAGQTA
jgi:RimJ/RimL family protein N-acetyltransferase